MTPFILVRCVTLTVALLAFLGFWLAIRRTGDWLRNVPMLAISLHGSLYYTVYLLHYFHPVLHFSLQAFADWGSVLLFQIFCTLALIAWDVATDFFTGHVWPFLWTRLRGGPGVG